MYEGRRVLVAGGTGVIGVPVVKRLVNLGAMVTVVSLQPREIAAVNLGETLEHISFMQADLTDPKVSDRVVKGNSVVFNLVGIKGSVGVGFSQVASVMVPTIRFQTNLLDSSFKAGVERFLFTGSVCSYPQALLHREESMWDGLPMQNDRYTGIAKRLGEAMAEAYELEHGWDAVRVVRPSNVYGPLDDFDPRSAQVIPSLIAKAASSQSSLYVWGDGTAVRDFIFSDDVAKWMIKVVAEAPSKMPLNLGSGEGFTIREVAETVVKVVKPSLRIDFDGSKPAGDPVRILSTERITGLLDYGSLTSLEDGIRRTYEWFSQTPELQRKFSNSLDNLTKYASEIQVPQAQSNERGQA